MKLNIDHRKIQLSELYNEWKSNNVLLKPDYQRDYVWSKEMKEKLLDSFLLNLPIHSIVFAVFTNRLTNYREVIDGKHRLQTLFEHLDSLKNTKDFRFFKMKTLTITEIIDPNHKDILEIYRRLNYLGIQHK